MRGFLISAPETLPARSACNASELTISLIAESDSPLIAYFPPPALLAPPAPLGAARNLTVAELRQALLIARNELFCGGSTINTGPLPVALPGSGTMAVAVELLSNPTPGRLSKEAASAFAL